MHYWVCAKYLQGLDTDLDTEFSLLNSKVAGLSMTNKPFFLCTMHTAMSLTVTGSEVNLLNKSSLPLLPLTLHTLL